MSTGPDQSEGHDRRAPRQQPTVPTPADGGRPPEVFDRLAALVDEVLELDWQAESCSDKAAGLVALATQVDRLGVADGRGVQALETDPGWAAEGFRSLASKTAYESNQSRGTARRRCRDARQLRDLPLLADAVAAGEVNGDAARLILRADTADLHEQLVRDEKLLVEQAGALEYQDFAQAMRYWAQLADTDQADEDAAQRAANRAVHASRTYDGRLRLDGWLDPIPGTEWLAELERLEQQAFEADWAEARDRLGDAATKVDLMRTAEQRRHDALVEMARRSATHASAGPAPRGRVVVTLHMDYPTFLAELARHTGDPTVYPTDRLCELDDGTVVTPSEALNAALGGEVRRIVFGADGHILDFGRARRLFTRPLAAAIGARDRRCCEPGCLLPAARCQVDHVTEWHDGGPTSSRNGEMGCRFHNVWKHLNPLEWRRQRWRHHRRFDARPPPPRS